MRIVIKPVGLMFLVAMIGVLATLAFLKNNPKVEANAAPLVSATTPSSSAQPSELVQSAGTTLTNAGFESDFAPVPSAWSGAKGQAKGVTATAWHDDSVWGPADVEYASDKVPPHSGSYSQRIKLVSRQADGRCQFVQDLPGKSGASYREIVWVRASQPNVPVTLLLRQKVAPFTEYKSTTVRVGTSWQKLTLDGTVSQEGEIFFMVSFDTPGATIWLDDAKITEL